MTINVEKIKERLLKHQTIYKDFINKTKTKTKKPLKTINRLFNNIVNTQNRIVTATAKNIDATIKKMDAIIKKDDAKLEKQFNKTKKQEKELKVKYFIPHVYVMVDLYYLKDEEKQIYENHTIEYDNGGYVYTWYLHFNFLINHSYKKISRKYIL